MSKFSIVAKSVHEAVSNRMHISTTDRDSEWQRVNSYIADVLKDAHVLYAKLARLQGDFAGAELEGLEKISESVLDIGGKLSSFSKAFYEGKASMSEEEAFGEDSGPMFGGSPSSPSLEAPGPAEPPSASGGDVDIDFDYSPEESEEESEEEGKPEKEEEGKSEE